ncbi:MAG: hypothetical protein ACO1RX_12050 [Candidatus Sericytochromatia bacterium]
MVSLRSLGNEFSGWQNLAKLDADNSGGVTRQEVQQTVDTDQDQALSPAELTAAGLGQTEAGTELQARYASGSSVDTGVQQEADFSPVLFDMAAVRAQVQSQAPAAEAAQALRKLGSGDMRTVLNQADANRDGDLTLGELRALDLPRVTRLSSEMGVASTPKGTAQLASLSQLNTYTEALAGAGLTDNDVVLGFEGSVFDMNVRAVGDGAGAELAAARERDVALQADPAALAARREAVLGQVGNAPAVSALFDSLAAQGRLGEESLLSFEKIVGQHGQEVAEAVSGQLNQLQSAPGPLSAAERAELAQDVLRDLAYPAEIDQGTRATCNAAAAQGKLAITNPVRYSELVSTLGQDKPFESTLQLNTTYANDPSDQRSLSARIVQNALMDYAQRVGDGENTVAAGADMDWSSEAHYTRDGREVFYDSRFSADPAQDRRLSPEQLALAQNEPALAGWSDDALEDLGSGLLSAEAQRMEAAVLGSEVRYQDVPLGDDAARAALMDSIDASLDRGRPVSTDVSIGAFDSGGHAVLITARLPGEPPLYRLNSWGKEYEASRDQLTSLLVGARID